jgi:hypothetical protein
MIRSINAPDGNNQNKHRNKPELYGKDASKKKTANSRANGDIDTEPIELAIEG